MTLIEHIKSLNAKTLAWVAEDPANRWSTTLVEDPAHWATYGVTTVEEFERHTLEGSIWDLYKDAHGVRPRGYDFKAMTTEQLKGLQADLIAFCKANAEWEAEYYREADARHAEWEAEQRRIDELARDEQEWTDNWEHIYERLGG